MGCFHNQRMSINERKNIVLYSKYKVCEIKNNAKEIFLSLSFINRSFFGFTNLPYYIFSLEEEDIFFSLKQRIKAIHHFVTSIFFFL